MNRSDPAAIAAVDWMEKKDARLRLSSV